MSNTPQRFTKRPVTVEAIQWDGTQSGATPIIDWILNHDHSADYWAPGEWDHETNAAYIRITTLEGNMIANQGDWIIRGVQGEFYPCKPGIFDQTYEPAAEHQEPPNAEPTNAEVEAAARAVFETRDDPYDDTEWGELTSADRERWECYARAALLAAWEVARHE